MARLRPTRRRMGHPRQPPPGGRVVALESPAARLTRRPGSWSASPGRHSAPRTRRQVSGRRPHHPAPCFNCPISGPNCPTTLEPALPPHPVGLVLPAAAFVQAWTGDRACLPGCHCVGIPVHAPNLPRAARSAAVAWSIDQAPMTPDPATWKGIRVHLIRASARPRPPIRCRRHLDAHPLPVIGPHLASLSTVRTLRGLSKTLDKSRINRPASRTKCNPTTI